MKLVHAATVGKLYPSAKQERAMARIGGQCRSLWNHWLAANMARYEADKKFIFYNETGLALKAMRQEERYQGLPRRCGDRVLQALDEALRSCARSAGAGRKGFPHFKKQIDRNDAFQFIGREARVEGGRIKLPALGWLRARGLSPALAGARLTIITVRQAAAGWTVTVQFEGPSPASEAAALPAVGVDLGLTSLVALSDGTKIPAPRIARKYAKRVRRLEREKSRRQRGSVNRRRTIERLRRVHARIAATRSEFTHKLTSDIVAKHQGVAVEALATAGMMRNRRVARSLGDAALASIRRQLKYKAEWACRDYREMPTFQRSTGVCPDCGTVGPRLPLAVREWRCDGCGAVHDRDVAAAQVILRGAVPVGDREPGLGRKRGLARRRGPASAGSVAGPPTNVAKLRASGETP